MDNHKGGLRMVDIYKLGKVKCPDCKTGRLELVYKTEAEKESRGVGFNSIRIVPIFTIFYRCMDCGELFLVQIDPDNDGKKV